MPLESEYPLLQVKPHEPPVHVAVAFDGALHAMPHPPQWLVLDVVFTHVPLQLVGVADAQHTPLDPTFPELQHTPFVQLRPPVHRVPQAPQLLLSASVSTHEPLHDV
jgi:hypothetical protein